MSSQSELEENASNCIARFVSELAQTGGGSSEGLRRDQNLDRNFHQRTFYGFKLVNRGNVHELLVPTRQLPDGPCNGIVVILDGQNMVWEVAMSAVRSRPSELREALDTANRPSVGH